MALLQVKEFAELCGLEAKQIHTYASRGKVVKTGTQIDDSLEINKNFLSSRKVFLETKGFDHSKELIEESKVKELAELEKQNTGGKKREKHNQEFKDHSFDETKDVGESLTSLAKRERVKKIIKLEEEITKLRMYNSKQEGSVVPMDFVKTVISQLSSSIATQFMIEIHGWLILVCKELNVERDQYVKYKHTIDMIINKAHDDGVKTAKKTLTVLANDFSISKEVGQHD